MMGVIMNRVKDWFKLRSALMSKIWSIEKHVYMMRLTRHITLRTLRTGER